MTNEANTATQAQETNEENLAAQPDATVESMETEESEVQSPDSPEAKIVQLELALAQKEEMIKSQQETVLRAHADVENMRRRTEQEVEKARKFALKSFATDLLPVVDNLERAMEAVDASDEALKPILEGVDLTHKTLIDVAGKFGLQPIDPQGEKFDPESHQAMSMQESADFEPNTVMVVMQKGYALNGRVIRPAMVMVSKAPA